MLSVRQYSYIICDLGDVLFKWSRDTKTCISPNILKSILSSPTWFDYERGRLSQQDCYSRVGEEFNLHPDEIRRALEQARSSLVAADDLLKLLRELKEQANGTLRIFGMSNISHDDWEVLRTKSVDWSIFDEVFTSSAVGERKPNLGFYKHVIQATQLDPRRAIFVDDKLENVLSARSLGFHGIVCDTTENVKRALRNIIGDPVARGNAYLQNNARKLVSITASSDKQREIVLHENFAQLLILETTKNPDIVHLVEHDRTWNFFHEGKGQLTTKEFPFDIDTTSLGLTVLKRERSIADSVMDEMLEYVDEDGIIQTYFDHRRPRFDPVVCVNALTFFYSYGRGGELPKTLQWVYEVLLNRAYLDGTRYYQTAECFLYCLSRLLASSEDPNLHFLLKSLLRERVQERIGAEGDALALAMRIIVCDFVGVKDEVDLRTLLPLQCEDGGWEIGWIYKYGTSGLRIGNRGLTTALAIKAIETSTQHTLPPCESPSPTVVAQPFSSPSKWKVFSVLPGKQKCRRVLKNTFQRIWHGRRMRKPLEISSRS